MKPQIFEKWYDRCPFCDAKYYCSHGCWRHVDCPLQSDRMATGDLGINILRPPSNLTACERFNISPGIVYGGMNPFTVSAEEKRSGKLGRWHTRPWAIIHPDCDGKLYMARGIESFCTPGNRVDQAIGVLIGDVA